MSAHTVVATGSYSSNERGRGAGIDLLALDPTAPSLEPLASLPIEDASYLVWSADGSLLYAVQETSPTRVVALRVSPDAREVEVAGSLELTGAGGCHIAHGAVPGTLLVTDYASGHVEVVRLDVEGLPDRLLDVCDHTAYRRGGEPHPHQTVLLPGAGLLAVSDLGLDRVYVYAQAPDGTIDLATEVALSRGQGPRHLATDHESRSLYIACEISGELAVAVRDRPAPGSASAAGTSATTGGTPGTPGTPDWTVVTERPASGTDVQNYASHIELTEDEAHLVLANRGPDSISVLSLGPARPELVDEIEVGAHPRHFARVGDLVLVAAQESDRIDLVRWDGARLTTAAEPFVSPSVCCIAPRP